MTDLQETVAIAIGSLPLNEDGEYLLDYWGDDMVDRAAEEAIDALLNALIAEWSKENGNLDLYDDEGRHWSVAAWLHALKKNAGGRSEQVVPRSP